MRDQKVFYGWWVVGAFSVTTFMSTGVRHAVRRCPKTALRLDDNL